MRVISVYTELGCLYDERRAIIERLLPAGEKWETTFEKLYLDRRIDWFEKPEIGVTMEKYKAAMAARDITLFTSILPTSLLTRILTLILDVDQMIGKPINIGTVGFTINCHPYVLDADMKQELETSLLAVLPYNAEIVLVDKPNNQLTASYFRPFTHVFKYDILGEASEAFCKTLAESPIKDVKFFVPDLYAKDPETKTFAVPEEVIQKMGIMLSSALTLIPIRHQVYDYRTVE